jgi:cleavage stimulation factor subunit 2
MHIVIYYENIIKNFFQAALIMQVLQLSDEQIAMLPPEQRQSILVLKEQIAKSTQR